MLCLLKNKTAPPLPRERERVCVCVSVFVYTLSMVGGGIVSQTAHFSVLLKMIMIMSVAPPPHEIMTSAII